MTVFDALWGARRYFTNNGSYDGIARDDLVDRYGTDGEGLLFDADLVTDTALPFGVTGFAARDDCEKVKASFSLGPPSAVSSLCLDSRDSHEIRVLLSLRGMK